MVLELRNSSIFIKGVIYLVIYKSNNMKIKGNY